jgi:DNA mismatch repair protein MutS
MAMMKSYYTYQKDIEKKYGPRSVIFMMVGSFYEMYEFENTGKAHELSSLLNITLTQKDKKKDLSSTNPYMCGFPSYCLKKYVDILVRQYDYTVGIVDQMEEIQLKGLKQRELSKVYSPCIPYEYDFDCENEITVDRNEQVCLIVGYQKQRKNHISKDQCFFLSYVVLNLSFGNVMFNEEEHTNEIEVIDKIRCICKKNNISEIILIGSSNFSGDDIKTHHFQKIDVKYSHLEYQQKILQKVYPLYTEQNIISSLNLERQPVIVEYLTFLFEFIYDHCPLVLKKIQSPIRTNDTMNVHYNIRTYYELNVLNQDKMDRRCSSKDMSLSNIIDKTSTSMGSRFLHHLLFVPIHDIKKLEERYDRVAFFLKDMKTTENRRSTFRKLCDIEKKWRLIGLSKISPYDMSIVIQDVERLLPEFPLLENDMEKFSTYCRGRWNIDKMLECRSTLRFETCFELVEEEDPILTEKIRQLDDFMENSGGVCQIKIGSSGEIQITTTKRRWSGVKHRFPDIHLTELKTLCYVRSRELDELCYDIQKRRQILQESWRQTFYKQIVIIAEQFEEFFITLIDNIRQDDVYMTFAYCSNKYKYCRPTIIEHRRRDDRSVASTLHEKSFIECYDMRHAIIEHVQEDEIFTTNDVLLKDEKIGMLVYGLNSSGKSTYLKSIGLCVILAQIGMYVPCSSFRYYPFEDIFTKIYVMDDIYKGQSTFLYELNELLHILRECDEYSLILCDELTSGTETLSATGLLVSTVLSCIESQSRFVFTTHLHTLSNFPEITKNKNLDIKHFAVQVKDDKISYNRRLEQGTGDSLYGIEIACVLGFPQTFIKKAYDIRNKMLGKTTELVTNKRSRYNKKVIMEKCMNCGTEKGLHTHHIVPQKLCDGNGYIDNFHKDIKCNLQVLCEECHHEIHHS